MSNTTFSSQVKVNHENHTIEITKKLNTASKRYGSEAYIFLESVREKHPGYRLVVKETKRRTALKNLTYKNMEEYIEKHDETGKIMKEFMMLTGKVTSDEDVWCEPVVASYLEVRGWFLKKFPEIEQYRENARKGIQDILDAA